MMPDLLLELVRRGISLRVEGRDLRYRAPADAVTAEVKDFLAANKAALIQLLADPREAARATWGSALEETAGRWNVVAADCRARGEEPPWLDEGVDERFQSQIGEAIRAGDLPKALAAIDGWRAAWLMLLDPTNPTKTHPATEGDPPICAHIHIRRDPLPSKNPTKPTSERQLAPADGPPPSEGLIACSNPGVHRMFTEALEHFGPRAFEEGSLTAWLQVNAPEVARQWPQAPAEASWLEWRRQVGQEQVEAIDRAWREVNRRTKEKE